MAVLIMIMIMFYVYEKYVEIEEMNDDSSHSLPFLCPLFFFFFHTYVSVDGGWFG